MDGYGRYYAKWNKSNGERQILYDFTQVEYEKLIKTNEPNCDKHTEIEYSTPETS